MWKRIEKQRTVEPQTKNTYQTLLRQRNTITPMRIEFLVYDRKKGSKTILKTILYEDLFAAIRIELISNLRPRQP